MAIDHDRDFVLCDKANACYDDHVKTKEVEMNAIKTLIMIKPDAIERGLVDEILEKFSKIEFGDFSERKEGVYTKEDLEFMYHHLINEPFWPRILNGMVGKPYIAFVGSSTTHQPQFDLSYNSFVAMVRTTVDEVREMWFDEYRPKHENLVHASSSVEDAKREVKYFFSD